MKEFVIKGAIFFAMMFVIDRVVGYAFSYFVEQTKGGYVGHHQYMSNEMQKDILIFGSSRAVHHYDAKLIEDSLGMTCYNCGQDGNGAIFNYGQWILIKERYQPKVIIYDVFASFDLQQDDNHKYLGWLKLYYDRSGIPEVFDEVDKTERIKMLSLMYRYNYNPLQFFADYIHPIYQVDPYGFLPEEGELDTMQIRKNRRVEGVVHEFDTQKIYAIEKLVKERGDARFIFVISPCWYGMDSESLKPIKEICQREKVKFYDFGNNPKYVRQNQYFKDGLHLNAKGAEEFSKDLLKYMKD